MIKIKISFCAIFLTLIVKCLEWHVFGSTASFGLSILTRRSLRLRFIALNTTVVWYWCLKLSVLLIIDFTHNPGLFHCEFHGSGSLLFISVIFVHQYMLLLRRNLRTHKPHFTRPILFAITCCAFVLLYFVDELLMSILFVLFGPFFDFALIDIWLHLSTLLFQFLGLFTKVIEVAELVTTRINPTTLLQLLLLPLQSFKFILLIIYFVLVMLYFGEVLVHEGLPQICLLVPTTLLLFRSGCSHIDFLFSSTLLIDCGGMVTGNCCRYWRWYGKSATYWRSWGVKGLFCWDWILGDCLHEVIILYKHIAQPWLIKILTKPVYFYARDWTRFSI